MYIIWAALGPFVDFVVNIKLQPACISFLILQYEVETCGTGGVLTVEKKKKKSCYW